MMRSMYLFFRGVAAGRTPRAPQITPRTPVIPKFHRSSPQFTFFFTFPILFLFIPGCGSKPPEGMVSVPEDTYLIGTDEVSLEREAEEAGISKPWVLDATPAHRVHLAAYFIDRYEVTNGDYFRFVSAKAFPTLPHWQNGRPRSDQVRLPVTYVDWVEATAYCQWAGKRLPTEAEWEAAARGPQGWIYPWGYFFDPRRANVGGLQSGPSPVGSFPRGKSPFGVYDMIGNVWEWTADWYKPYPGSDYESADFGERYRVARGNSWAGLGHFSGKTLAGVMAAESRATYRLFFPPLDALEDVGFRCAKNAPRAD